MPAQRLSVPFPFFARRLFAIPALFLFCLVCTQATAESDWNKHVRDRLNSPERQALIEQAQTERQSGLDKIQPQLEDEKNLTITLSLPAETAPVETPPPDDPMTDSTYQRAEAPVAPAPSPPVEAPVASAPPPPVETPAAPAPQQSTPATRLYLDCRNASMSLFTIEADGNLPPDKAAALHFIITRQGGGPEAGIAVRFEPNEAYPNLPSGYQRSDAQGRLRIDNIRLSPGAGPIYIEVGGQPHAVCTAR
ncbi:hypothetical protein LJB82_00205 [Desulfovibrio sp. OttesenSCG-928-M16]|nr:hypothetical protein [Desulfovibrio sp. OttesenSCG-928-M16]